MSFLAVVLCELKAIITNKVVVLVVFIGTCVYGLLYPTPYITDVVTGQKLVIVDEDKSALSKQLIFLVGATPQIELLEEVDSLDSARKEIADSQAGGILFIPKGFEANAKMGIGSVVSYMGNASYFLIYGAIVEGVHNAIDELSDQLRKSLQPDILQTNIISYQPIALYNENLGYVNYALAAVLVFILHQTLIGGIGILCAYQNRISHKNQKDYFNKIPIITLLLARILVFSGIYCVWFLVYFGVLFASFGVHIHAHIVDFWCFALMFIFSSAAAGIMLGVCCDDESLPTQIVFVSSMPLVFIMGFIWPSDLLPEFLRQLSFLIPAYHGVRGFISLNQMGADFSSIMPHFLALLAIFVFCFCASVWILSNKRKNSKKREKQQTHNQTYNTQNQVESSIK